MGFIVVVLFIAALVAFVTFKGSYLLMNKLQPERKPLDKAFKLGVAAVIAFAAIIIWLLSD